MKRYTNGAIVTNQFSRGDSTVQGNHIISQGAILGIWNILSNLGSGGGGGGGGQRTNCARPVFGAEGACPFREATKVREVQGAGREMQRSCAYAPSIRHHRQSFRRDEDKQPLQPAEFQNDEESS